MSLAARHRARRRLKRLNLSELSAQRPPARLGGGLAWVAVPVAVVALAGTVEGPVAAALAALYSGVAVAVLRGHRRRRAALVARERSLDAVAGLAADLRAGLPVPQALATARDGLAGEVPAVAVACALSERTGAQLADLFDRVEAQLRAAGRVRDVLASQTAGVRASGWLLMLLPVPGIAVGTSMNADPVHVLLHTRIGALSAVAAALLQIGGLLLIARLLRMVAP